jgi:hypothetical protein
VVEAEAPAQEDALKSMLTGWLTHLGPTTANALAALLHLPIAEIDKTLLRIETTGLILRGNFDKTLGEETQWSERRLLARIHRLTLGTLRKQIEPVASATFMRWLLRWRDLLISFRRLEDRGEIRGGRFISGFIGEQFALPVAVESLRAMKSIPPAGEIVTISAADPLNLAGIVVPGERVPAISGKYLSFKDGVLVETPETPILSMAGRI